MAKTGMGSISADLQSGLTPTVADTTKATLEKALGSMVQNMDLDTDNAMEDTSTPPVHSEAAGFTPEGELLPLDERAELAEQGMMNPEYDDWQAQGSQVDPATQELLNKRQAQFSSDVVPTEVAPGRDDVNNMMARAERFSMNIDKAQRPDGFKINWHPKANVRDDFVDLNKRIARSSSMAEKLELSKAKENLMKTSEDSANTLPETMNTKLNAVVSDPNTGLVTVDPDFGRIASMATENAVDNAFLGASAVEETMEDWEADPNGGAVPANKINPSDFALRTGREVAKWWGAEQAARGEQTQPNLNERELKDLGAAALLTYAGSFPSLLQVDYTKGGRNPDGTPNAEGMRFILTPKGERQLMNNRGTRSRMFDTRIQPSREPQPDGLTGASAREKPAIRGAKDIGSNDKAYASLKQLKESISNQNSVAHVVDDRRTRIALTMLMPTLYTPINDPSNRFSDVFGLGTVSYDTTVKEQVDIAQMEETKAHDFAARVMNQKKKDAAREIKALADNRGVSNYLTFGAQPMTGRTMAQQTDFNPTRKKLIRFATRSKHPAVIRSKSGRLYENYMNIMALSFGKDDMLPSGRMADLNQNKEQYVSWGNQLSEALDKALPKAQYEQGMEAIRAGQKVPDMSKQLMQFQNSLAPDLLDFLIKKGEDAPMAVDALIDFAEFHGNMDRGQPHKSFVNAYVDGKTNGIANQGMMLGIRKLATKVGALRNADSSTALDGGDVRQAMADLITDRIQSGHIPVIPMEQLQDGRDQILVDTLTRIGQAKPINKAISMIFPYGKEIQGMKGEIAAKLPEVRANDPVLDAQINELVDSGIPLDDIISASHDNVVYTLFEIFGEDTFKTRSIMRHVGFLHAVTDKLFSIRGPVGHRINLGDKRLNLNTTQESRVAVGNTDQPKNTDMALKLNVSDSYSSSAAVRPTSRDPRGEAAGHVRGRAAVIPTQSMDAATVIRTSTGRSWDKLKQVHPAQDPYFFQIYDAFKVDPHNYDVMTDQINQNWMDITTRDWSFLEEAQKELKGLTEVFEQEMMAMPDKSYSTAEDGRFSYIGRLMDPEGRRGQNGEMVYQRGTAKAFVASVFPIDPDGNFMGRTDFKRPSTRKSPADIMKDYNNFLNDQAGLLQKRIVDAVNSVGSRRIKVGEIPDSINSREALAIYKEIMKFSHSNQRLDALVTRTNRNRNTLREEVMRQKKRTGFGALQYWAH